MAEYQSNTKDREKIEIDERKIERIDERGVEERRGEEKNRKIVGNGEAGKRKGE